MKDMDSVKDAQRLSHIIQAIRRIRRSLDGVTWEEFMSNEDKQGNVVRCLEIIGEASNHVSLELRTAHPEIPWSMIIGMRNNLVHGYSEVNYEFVWATVCKDLQLLEEKMPDILSGLKLPSDFTPPTQVGGL